MVFVIEVPSRIITKYELMLTLLMIWELYARYLSVSHYSVY